MIGRRCRQGQRVDGPAIIEEFGSTTVVFPGQVVEADPHGILVIRPAKSAHDEPAHEVTP